MLSELQKQAAQAIVNIFETGKTLGDYARVTLLSGDPGHLTYGRSQTTLGSGNLYLLVKAYCDAPNAACARVLKPYLKRLADIDLSLDRDMAFRAVLKEAGGDPAMQDAQDAFFDRVYWTPAAKTATTFGFASPLSTAVVYDSLIHGSWSAMRDRTTARVGEPNKAGEKKWVPAYVAERRNWLATHPNALLQKTVYRMDAFNALIKNGNWSLGIPMSVCGVSVDAAALSCRAPVVVSASDAATRNLRLTEPPMTGNDVKALQKALSRDSYAVNGDGIFDEGLESALKAWQQEYGVVADGVAGPATRTMLGL
ncbi:MAG: peptidoglycan-binding protein [Parvibaculum sp.]|uniref:peptidoglycan-binding protein n=1 Tax=Parvibaculum sp. TaxID=2024848 RepID=UPI0025D593B0|nr:peptidoglycan-binding protein [Parvibaculum sp.]MCE9650546.1 peptidoglycan-binding protein [Parvibaculum sp.]